MNESEGEADFTPGELTVVVGKDNPTQYRLLIDRLAIDKAGTCYLLGCVGDAGAIKSLRAALHPSAGVTAAFAVEGVRAENPAGNGGRVKGLAREPSGYTLDLAALGHRRHHALFRSRAPGFLAVADDETLWGVLRRPAFTTPLLRHWVGPIADALRGGDLLRPLYGFRARSALLSAATADLDAIVTAGVVAGTLTFREFDVITRE